MTHQPLIAALGLAFVATNTNSCQTKVAPEVTQSTMLAHPQDCNRPEVRFVDKEGHRFAVVLYDRGAGICEVTEASTIKPEPEDDEE